MGPLRYVLTQRRALPGNLSGPTLVINLITVKLMHISGEVNHEMRIARVSTIRNSSLLLDRFKPRWTYGAGT